MYNAFRPVCHAVVALYFGSDLANFEVLHVYHAVHHFLRLLAEWIEREILLQVGLQRFSIRMCLELNELLDCFFAGEIMLLDRPKIQCHRDNRFLCACQNGRRTFSCQSLSCPGVHSASSV